MKKILKTKQLEFNKSTFFIDLIKLDSGSFYIELVQRIHNERAKGQTIKINPSILMDIVDVLLEYHQKVPQKQVDGFLHFTESDKENLQARYLKGVTIADLALQYGASERIIEMILRNRGIPVMSDVEPEKKVRWRRG